MTSRSGHWGPPESKCSLGIEDLAIFRHAGTLSKLAISVCMYTIVGMTSVMIILIWVVLRHAHLDDALSSDQFRKAAIAPIRLLKSQHDGGSDIELWYNPFDSV